MKRRYKIKELCSIPDFYYGKWIHGSHIQKVTNKMLDKVEGGVVSVQKFSIRFTLLCILVLLACVGAWAVSVGVSNLKQQDTNVEVETFTSSSGDPMFSITRTNAENGKLYLVVIRSGGEAENPSQDNVVYMDMVKAEGDTLNISKVYPKSMDVGSYRVYMSDYAQGELKQVATFDVQAQPNPPTPRKGDLDGNGELTIDDILQLIQLVANRTSAEEAGASAEIDGNEGITVDDIMMLIQMVANRE